MNTTTGPCRLCGGAGVIRCADVYTSHGPLCWVWSGFARRESLVLWDLSQTILCGCRYKETP